MSDLFDSVITESTAERPAFRQAPPGDYLVTIRAAKEVKANSGTKGVEFTFTIMENVDGSDLEGVDLSKCRLTDTQWVTEKTLDFVRERFIRIAPETKGTTIRDAMDILPGNEAIVTIEHETTNRDGTPLRTPRLSVLRYYSVAWYTANKNKAAA
jgi:hypothetical protein